MGNKANVDCKDKELHSAVHWAVVCGQLEALDVLCNSGALVNSPDIHGAFPLHYAAQMCGPTDASSDTKVSCMVKLKMPVIGLKWNFLELKFDLPITALVV